MPALHDRAFTSVKTGFQQVTLSVAATLIATVVYTGLRAEFRAISQPATPPALTSGGKFAARLERSGGDDQSFAMAMPLPPMRLIAAEAKPVPVAFQTADAAMTPTPAAWERTADAQPRPVKRAAAPAKHRAAQVARAEVVPPRRADSLAVDATAATPATLVAEDSGIWSSTKGVMHDTLTISGSLLQKVNPLTLLP